MITESKQPKTTPVILLAVLAGFAAMAAGMWFGRTPPSPDQSSAWQATVFYPEPRPIEAFELVDAEGAPFRLEAFRGDWDLVFFGFTHCPDICPGTLAILRDTNALLVEQGLAPARVTLISVDPERDRPEVMRDYVAFFDESFRAATGDPEPLERFALSLGAAFYVEPHEPEALDYLVDHSAAVMIVDPDGRLVGQLRPPPSAEAFAADLARLIAG